ncbi:TraU family protein [Methylomonas sp. AM2-LC]|uniref:TraU family protein n=1 Tax=Methylomonas sp. AM2-LC TaxID=3153301 RepID=UPI0032666A43
MITSVCWTCLFPVRLFGTLTLFGDSMDVPDGAADEVVCSCEGKGLLPDIGITAGAWLPAKLIEVVRKPYCSPALGGISFNNSVRLWGGHKETHGTGKDKTYYNYHYWAFPLYVMMDLLVQTNCEPDGMRTMDMMYMSEVDPTWNYDELAFFINPEAIVFANPLAMASCVVDCAQSAIKKPNTSLWWCAGCWGNLYPFTGNIASDSSAPRDTSLLSARALAGLHRKGLAKKTYGNDALCRGVIAPMIPKQQYKFSMLFPVAEANSTIEKFNVTNTNGTPVLNADGTQKTETTYTPATNCCHYIGVSPFLWGEWRTIPGSGEDYVYMLWRYTDCCLGAHN